MIDTNITVELTLEEVCELAEMPAEILIYIVDEGVLEPSGTSPDELSFDITMLSIARRATRLHRNFDID